MFLQQFNMMDFLCDICGVSKLKEFEIKDHKRKAHDNLDQFVATWETTLLKTTFFNFDTFELSGESLLKTTDEITEATHSALRIHDERHGY